MSEILLHLEQISKSFSGVPALADMRLDVKKGSVHALMGENGAGKSTLMKILTGVYTRDQGIIEFDGHPLDTSTVAGVIRQGISMIYQEINPIQNMTVAENIFCGKEICKVPHLLVNKKETEKRAQELLDAMGYPSIRANRKVQGMSTAEMQIMEIAKAISNESKLIIMDEPTSAITERETEQLMGTIRDLQQKGISFIYISHKLNEIYRIADEVTVMRDGRYVATKSTKEAGTDELVAMMVGREMTEYYPKEKVEQGEVLLRVTDLCVGSVLHDISFEAHRGEILGFAGLMGAGRTEIMETIMGIREADSGEIAVAEKPLKVRHPADAIGSGLSMITEDRRKTGCFLDADVYNNTMTLVWKRFGSPTGIRHRACRKAAREQIALFSTKTTGLSQKMRELSGGNQQKVILSRWLLTEPDILIMDEPTRGIDVGAKYDIYKEMVRLAKEGKCILMISSELPEILGMSDRIVVVHEGRISGILDRDEADQETILRYAAGLVNGEDEG